MPAQGTSGPRVALISVGLGRIQRGFERYFSGLFNVLQDRMDITLFKSGGSRGPHERVPRLLRAGSAVSRRITKGRSYAGEAGYKGDCVAFGISLLPELCLHRFDVIHCIDPPLAKLLSRVYRGLPFHPRLLFTEGCATPTRYYPKVTHIHHVADTPYRKAISEGVPARHMTMVPCGMETSRFSVGANRAELRRKYGISEDTFVILAISAIDRIFKRVDYIIDEVSQLEGDILLWLDGHPEDPSLVELAHQRLGPRCRITHMPSSAVPELYRTADVMAHASTTEAFGLAVLEAITSELMVLTHCSEHFEWLIGDRRCLIDMTRKGALAGRLREMIAAPREQISQGVEKRAAEVRSRFDWSAVAPSYIELYRKVAALPAGPNGSVGGE